ncbi:MAG: hypothetical protein ABIY50_09545 [Ignavibacteria bacterium]
MIKQETRSREAANINKANFYKSFIPSLLILIISYFFGDLFKIVTGFFSFDLNSENLKRALEVSDNLKFYPVLAYLVFVGCIWWLKKSLDEKISEGRASRKELSKMVDKWSGIVDGIGTVLPLIGAAVILFTIGLGRENEDLFIGFAVPFEIKSLFILAIAKLFEFAFDELEIQYLGKIYDDSDTEKTSTVQQIQFPDSEKLNEVNEVITNWNNTIQNMKDPEFKKNLENIIKIIGR